MIFDPFSTLRSITSWVSNFCWLGCLLEIVKWEFPVQLFLSIFYWEKFSRKRRDMGNGTHPCVSSVGDFFTDSAMVNHHFSPPFRPH